MLISQTLRVLTKQAGLQRLSTK